MSSNDIASSAHWPAFSPPCAGLTKLEYAAIQIAAGYRAREPYENVQSEALSELAVVDAFAVLKKCEEAKE